MLCASDEGKLSLAKMYREREHLIKLEHDDPYRYGFEPPCWHDLDSLWTEDCRHILLNGGNRSSKTEYAAKRLIQIMLERPDRRVWALHTTDKSSIQMQQSVVWKYVPPELKKIKKSRITNVGYSQKNGFADGTFIFPNGSQCFFMHYSQGREVIEGGDVDFIWPDELVPYDWIKTLKYRLITRKGKLLLTFTPIQGYSQVVREFVNGCVFDKTLPAPLLPEEKSIPGVPKGEMPYIATSTGGGRIMWFHTSFNPYNPYDELVKVLEGKSTEEIKIRAYGWADKLEGNQFPRFNAHNILPPNKIPVEGTNYMVIDPAGSRNWFMLWLRVDKKGNRFFYREWPGTDVGEWAYPSDKKDGKAGPGQFSESGRGLDAYKSLIRELEDKEEISERYIDPRAGATQAVGREGGTSLIDLMAEGSDPMWLTPAAGIRLEQGISILNDWLSYKVDEPVSSINQPSMFVSSECENLIWSLKEWTGLDGEKGACKDPIDCARYLAVMDPCFEDSLTYAAVGGGSY